MAVLRLITCYGGRLLASAAERRFPVGHCVRVTSASVSRGPTASETRTPTSPPSLAQSGSVSVTRTPTLMLAVTRTPSAKPCHSACMVCSDCKFPSRPRLPNRTRTRFHLNGCHCKTLLNYCRLLHPNGCNLARRGHGGAVMMCDRHRAADRCNMLFTYCNMLANSVTLRDRYFRILSSIRTSKVDFVGQQAFPRATPDQRGYVVASSRG